MAAASMVAFVCAVFWKAQLSFEARTVDLLVQLVDHEGQSLGQVVEMASILGGFAESKRDWIEDNFQFFDHVYPVGTNATTFAIFGFGTCGWASELAVLCFNQMGYETRLVQILDEDGFARHIVMDVRLPSGEWVIFDALLNHLHIDATTGLPLSAEELGEMWNRICPEYSEDRFCRYSFEHGVRYTNWGKFGPLGSSLQLIFDWIGVKSLRSSWLVSREPVCNVLLILLGSNLLFLLSRKST